MNQSIRKASGFFGKGRELEDYENWSNPARAEQQYQKADSTIANTSYGVLFARFCHDGLF
jgi:hypothetical protein